MERPEQHLKIHAELFEPTKAELATLQIHEQKIRFEILPPIGISEGRQSRVSILEYRVENQINRVLWKRMGAGKHLTEPEARGLAERLRPYRSELMRAGWNIPELFYITTVALEGEHQIFSYEQLVGRGDGDKMLANPEEPNFRKWHLLRETARTLAHYGTSEIVRENIAEHEVSRLPHGLDLKLANVVLDEAGKLWFVDLFGPKELTPDGSWRIYSTKLDSLPEDKLAAVCATREGMLLRMYRLAEKVWSASGGITQDQLRKGFVSLLESLKLPNNELVFIINQIKTDFPWLDSIYKEGGV